MTLLTALSRRMRATLGMWTTHRSACDMLLAQALLARRRSP